MEENKEESVVGVVEVEDGEGELFLEENELASAASADDDAEADAETARVEVVVEREKKREDNVTAPQERDVDSGKEHSARCDSLVAPPQEEEKPYKEDEDNVEGDIERDEKMEW